jgi:2-succinyl-6-hydroxy-2,4-cyclohexadiene-1-carboxylate synthase
VSRLTVGDVVFEVRERGQGFPLLALHGFTGTGASWSALGDAFAERHRLIAPDLLGHGGTSASTDPQRYALERQADDLSGLLALLDARPTDLLGYSMGARIALVLALRHPDAVRRLVLESPSAGITDATARARRAAADESRAERLARDGLEAFVDDWQAQPLFESQHRLPRDVRERQWAERMSHQPPALAASLRGAGQGAMTPLHERLDEIGCPTLVIAGALDEIGLERARQVAVGLRTARLAVIEEAGHAPHLEQPAAYLELVSAWLLAGSDPVDSSPHSEDP